MDRYIKSHSPVVGTTSKGGDPRYSLSYWNAPSDSFVHQKSWFFFMILKNGKHLLIDLETNRLRTAIRPVICWISWIFLGELILSRAWIWSGFASIPCLVTKNPRNFSDDTPICIWNDLTSSGVFSECRMLLQGGRCDRPLWYFWRAYHLYKLPWFSQSIPWTSYLLISGILP